MFLALGIGLFVWKSGFGLWATERQLEWRVPVAYGDIRGVHLQLWRGEDLLKREERQFSDGVTSGIENSVPLTRGTLRAVAVVTLRDGVTKTFTTQVDPENNSRVVVDFKR